MKIGIFDVVELQNGDKATIKNINNNEYFAEIVNDNGITKEYRNMTDNEISKVLVSHKNRKFEKER